MNRSQSVFLILVLLALQPMTSMAEEAPEGDRVDVDAIKEKYWAKGKESELGVVQGRTYTKAGKFQFTAFGGFVSSDPFLSVKNLGGSAGYYFSEYFGLSVLGWKSYPGPSSALKTFEQTLNATTNNNPPRWYLGTEANVSLIYGKISLIGKKILYYDLHVLGGGGVTSTDNGNYLTPHLGVGQQIYFSKSVSFRVDYRAMMYKEDIKEKVIPTRLGQTLGQRTNWSNVFTLGVSFLIGKDEE